MMRNFLFLASFPLLLSCSGPTYTIDFDPGPVREENGAYHYSILYEPTGNHVQTRLGSYEITYPEDFHAQDTAFGQEYFAGYPGAIENGIGVLIANQKSGSPSFYVDRNNNLDFRDDGKPVHLSPEDSSVVLNFHRKDNPAATFSIEYFLPDVSPEDLAFREKIVHRDSYVEAGIPMMSARYWFLTKRLNNRVKITTVGGKDLKAAVHDFDCNGYYNDAGKDRIFIAPPNVEFTSLQTSGAFTLQDDSTLFAFRDQVYEVTEVDSLGRSLSIKKTDAAFEPPTAPGQKLPDFPFELIDGGDTSMSGFVDGQKYLLIDVWGSWCKGCHSSAAALAQLNEQYPDRLRILGLNTGEPEEKRSAFIEKYGHHWTHGILNAQIRDELLIDSYPTYILINPSGRIISLKSHPGNVKAILTDEMNVRN